jgi:hypothetical protein
VRFVDGWVGWYVIGEMHCILGAGVLLDLRQTRRIYVVVVFIMKNDIIVRHGSIETGKVSCGLQVTPAPLSHVDRDTKT